MLQLIRFIFFISFSFNASASPQRIAIVDVQKIMDSSMAVSGIRNSVEKISKSLQEEFIKYDKELKDVETYLLSNKDKYSEEEFQKEVARFNKRVTLAQKNMQEKKLRLEQAHAKAMSKINDVAIKVISDIAHETDTNVILPSTQVLYASESLNITYEVLKRLNNKMPSISLEF